MLTKIAFILFTTSAALSFLTVFASSGPVSSPAPSPESFFSPSPTGESGSPTAYSPMAMDECFTSLISMYDCQSYVIAGSNLTQPDKACCPELANVAANNTICLCKLFGNTSDTLGFTVDIGRATKLPSLCNVSTPDPSLCAIVKGQSSSLPPSPGLGAQPPTGVAGEGGVAGASPTAGNGKSGAIRASCSTSASMLVGLATITIFSMFF